MYHVCMCVCLKSWLCLILSSTCRFHMLMTLFSVRPITDTLYSHSVLPSERLQCVTTAAKLCRLVSMVTQCRAQKWWAGHCIKGGGGADVARGTWWPYCLPALYLF